MLGQYYAVRWFLFEIHFVKYIIFDGFELFFTIMSIAIAYDDAPFRVMGCAGIYDCCAFVLNFSGAIKSFSFDG
ncbi:hypothetical protein WT25_24220 [Burkholderia territorii]|nr:hypothetical protein WT25_24220 [Burkholderia territorii]